MKALKTLQKINHLVFWNFPNTTHSIPIQERIFQGEGMVPSPMNAFRLGERLQINPGSNIVNPRNTYIYTYIHILPQCKISRNFKNSILYSA